MEPSRQLLVRFISIHLEGASKLKIVKFNPASPISQIGQAHLMDPRDGKVGPSRPRPGAEIRANREARQSWLGRR